MYPLYNSNINLQLLVGVTNSLENIFIYSFSPSFLTDRPNQANCADQDQKEQSDQGQYCLLFCLHLIFLGERGNFLQSGQFVVNLRVITAYLGV